MSKLDEKTKQLSLVSDKKDTAHEIEDLLKRRTDEIIIAFVGPIGSGCTTSFNIFKKVLEEEYRYEEVKYYQLSNLITEYAYLIDEEWVNSDSKSKRVEDLQLLGNKLRQKYLDDYLAAKAIEKISIHRLENNGFVKASAGNLIPEPKRWAHVIDSLKNPAELKLLRDVYGDML